MPSIAHEVNFDGLIGPTHNYSGLSFGNKASTVHAKQRSYPRSAALQGLEKMELLMGLGLKQSLLLPHERPFMPLLKNAGFDQPLEKALQECFKKAPSVFFAAYSASSMWTANSATIAPSADTQDGKLHLTPANLITNLHRSIETDTTTALFEKIFHDKSGFCLHSPLWKSPYFSDEGAANHIRFCLNYAMKGVQLFVFGKTADQKTAKPAQFPARQTLESIEALVRQHQLDPSCVVKAMQNPKAIDAGVFHNDVISCGNKNVFLYHEESFIETENVIKELKDKFEKCTKTPLITIKIQKNRLSLKEAVSTYFFNSQLVEKANGKMALIAPLECYENAKSRLLLDEILQDGSNPIETLHFIDLKQSMQNGGGPACLRLRVVLTDDELSKIDPKWILTEKTLNDLKKFVIKHYREQLEPKDLLDPNLAKESMAALNELTDYFKLGNIYPFQRK